MPERKIRLRIVTPTREFFNDDVSMVIMRTSTGDIGVLAGHQPLTTTLDYGVLRIKQSNKELKSTMFGGFADIQPNCITILTDAAEWPEDIDVKRAEESKLRAENRIRDNKPETDILRAELSLKRAILRLDNKK